MSHPADLPLSLAGPDGLAYAELSCRSSFSFGTGASMPEELVARAHALGYAALAITDDCSVSGVVRAHLEAKLLGLKLLPGAAFVVPVPQASGAADSFRLIALPHNLQAWGDLCEFITIARRSAPKGQNQVVWPDASTRSSGRMPVGPNCRAAKFC